MPRPDWARWIPAGPTRLCNMRPGPSSRPTSMWSATACRWASSTTCRTPRSRTITPLFVRIEKPFTRRLSWLTSYTFSKAISNAPQFRNAGGVNGSENSPPQDSFNLRAERGAGFIRYPSPSGQHRGLPAALRPGSEVPALRARLEGARRMGDFRHLHAAIGLPLHRQPAAAIPRAWAPAPAEFSFAPTRFRAPTGSLSGDQQSTSRFFNTAAFASPAAGTFGNVGRNTIIGPGFVNADVVVARYIHVKEGIILQFRAEFFNTLNHPELQSGGTNRERSDFWTGAEPVRSEAVAVRPEADLLIVRGGSESRRRTGSRASPPPGAVTVSNPWRSG